MSDTTTLFGIRPDSLAGYLAGLGLARICSEQLRDDVMSSWSPQGFLLYGISYSELVDFIAERYVPSPIVSPWAGGSGFSEGEDTSAIDAIRESTDARFELYRTAIARAMRFPELPLRGMRVSEIEQWAADSIENLPDSNKQRKELAALLFETKKQLAAGSISKSSLLDELKQGSPAAKLFTKYKSQRRQANKGAIAARCRNELPDECVAWLDASVLLFINNDGAVAQTNGPLAKDAAKPKLEFSRLFMESVTACLLTDDRERRKTILDSVLQRRTIDGLPRSAAGLFSLGSAGGFNTGPGFEHKDMPNNPWAAILLFEGTLLWAGNVSRRASTDSASPTASAPFTVRHVAVGSGGSAQEDEKHSLAELWTPLWQNPARLSEVAHLISEGRTSATSGRARSGLDFAEAVAGLGVDRGVHGFARYCLVERRGPSYIALPVGQLPVTYRREVDLLRQLHPLVNRLQQFLREFPSSSGPPKSLLDAMRRIQEARFDVARSAGPSSILALVCAFGGMEHLLARRDPSKAPALPRPLGGLGAEWVDACGDAPEVRLAAAVASLARTGAAGPFRTYVAPLAPDKDWEYAPASRTLAWSGATLAQRLASVLHRRLLDARLRTSGGERDERNPTWGPRQVGLAEIADFLEPGLLDEQLLEELIFGFTWVKHARAAGGKRSAPGASPVPRQYALLKLLFLPDGVPINGERLALAPDPSIVPLLTAGRVDDAIALARRQLSAKGLRPRRLPEWGGHDTGFGARLAAALLFPMFQTDALVSDALLAKTEESTASQETA